MTRVGGIGGFNPLSKWGAGSPGPIGPPGIDGEEGQEGLSGTSGKDGQPGPIGPTGNIGRIGPPGLDGDDGTDGFAGNSGQQGGQGVAGPQGNPGSIVGQVVVTGPPGYDGNDGDDGFPGLPGPQGPAGTGGGGGGGALVLLEQHTASSSATLDFTTCISATYDEYLIEIVRLVPASAGSLYLRMGTGGGPTWDAGANYGWDDFRIGPGGAAAGGANSGQSQISLSGSTETLQTSATVGGLNGSFRLYDPLSTAGYKGLHGQTDFYSNLPTMVTNALSGRYISTTAVTGIRFLMSTGNIASGTIRVYGIAKI